MDNPQSKDSSQVPVSALDQLISLNGTEPSEQDLKKLSKNVLKEFELHNKEIFQNYNVLILFDSHSIGYSDSNNIYKSLTSFKEKRDVLLLIDSDGGEIAPAYFIGKLCRESTAGRFITVVPRRAKSAATLICCAADEIHMGGLSELGPIDPQFGGIPALALKYSIEHLAELARKFPNSTEIFSSYLSKSLKIEQLGYYERVAESAAQYAERLLKSRLAKTQRDISLLAKRLVYEYKDHGFVID